jgi:hypothetical protein
LTRTFYCWLTRNHVHWRARKSKVNNSWANFFVYEKNHYIDVQMYLVYWNFFVKIKLYRIFEIFEQVNYNLQFLSVHFPGLWGFLEFSLQCQI